MNSLNKIAIKIIKEQEAIIGPLAWIEAEKVEGLKILDSKKSVIDFETGFDQKEIINKLVARYERLFGKASHEVCRESVANILSELLPSEIPSSLVF